MSAAGISTPVRMLRCGKTAQSAIAAMSHLAENYDGGKTRLSSEDVARNRQLPQPLVAKVLTILSTASLVNGTRGPGGGYWLARAPGKITLADITARFEKEFDGMLCPFGPGWCGSGDPCPLHDQLVSLNREWDEFLHRTTLDVFAKNPGARRE
jgi:Rrf2 family transcriptional regulator, iron-sulfur cluster assembly transcription factor